MRKLTTTLVCAFAVLAFADPAAAEIYTVSDDEIDEFLEKLANEEEDDDLYDSQFDGVDMGIDSLCIHCRPIAYAVAFEHNGTWTVISDLEWDSVRGVYTVCWNSAAMRYVDGVRMYWKTTSSSCCDYCNNSTFDTAQYFNYDTWPQKTYQNTTGTDTCWPLIPAGRGYRGEELSYYNNFHFNVDDEHSIGRMNSYYPSYIEIVSCPG
jgi:hypothetical protein